MSDCWTVVVFAVALFIPTLIRALGHVPGTVVNFRYLYTCFIILLVLYYCYEYIYSAIQSRSSRALNNKNKSDSVTRMTV